MDTQHLTTTVGKHRVHVWISEKEGLWSATLIANLITAGRLLRTADQEGGLVVSHHKNLAALDEASLSTQIRDYLMTLGPAVGELVPAPPPPPDIEAAYRKAVGQG